ncbi:MAG: 3' terminal RNA ribose 2'-O-methyltransferase Hen1 [Acidobacteriota bacterium]
MFMTLTTTHTPATDLGYLLHKNPARIHKIEFPFGVARVFYPVATECECTAALMLDIDPVSLTRRSSVQVMAEHYVNDRPYVVSSFFSVAIGKVFGTALSGRSKERPDLAERSIPLRVEMPVVPARGGSKILSRLFEPLGYSVEYERYPLDAQVPDWGPSPYHRVVLEAECRLRDLLRHLYVLIPVLDDKKHYWVGEAEIEKLVNRGEGWLADHPDLEFILRRGLKRRGRLTRLALEQLTDDEPPISEREAAAQEIGLEQPTRLNDVRLDTVKQILEEAGARRVLDLGCGEGKLMQRLLRSKQFEMVVGLDASVRALELAHRRLRLTDASPKLRERVELLHGALTYRDDRLAGFDAAVLVEVIEHLDLPRLPSLERVVFGYARPSVVVVTTPNREYNARFESLSSNSFRHRDHRFEWSREECRAWAGQVGEEWGYATTIQGIGEEDPELGTPTQMVIFERVEE